MNNGTLRPCPRCGVMAYRRKRTTLCRDCKYVLSVAEWALWNSPGSVVESHEKEVA